MPLQHVISTICALLPNNDILHTRKNLHTQTEIVVRDWITLVYVRKLTKLSITLGLREISPWFGHICIQHD